MSDEQPRLAILLLTYKRTAEALDTIRSTVANLLYPIDKIGWYIADDGSPSEHHKRIRRELESLGQLVIGEHNNRFRDDDSYNCGRGWNQGLGICHQWSDFVLQLEDDWRMDGPLNADRYIRLLCERPEVGIVSFRILSVGADVHTVGHDGEVYLRYLRTTQYAYSGNPLIRHARYTTHYGWFASDRSPGLIELHQDDQYRLDVKDGPQIWRPVSISIWGGWAHTGTDKTWE